MNEDFHESATGFMDLHFAECSNPSNIGRVTTMIRTRYGYLSPVLLVAVQLCVTGIVEESVVALDDAHARLATRLTDPGSPGGSVYYQTSEADMFDGTVASRWQQVRTELFGTALLDIATAPVPDPAAVATLLEDAQTRRVTETILASVGMFLVEEASSLEEGLPFTDDESFEDLETIARRVLRSARQLRAHVKDGTWPHLAAASNSDMPDVAPASTPRDEKTGTFTDSDDVAGASPSPPTGLARLFLSYSALSAVDPGSVSRERVAAVTSGHALKVFNTCISAVPAYRDFLSRHGLTAGQVRDLHDFRRVPRTTHADLVAWGCDAETRNAAALWSTSSGSSGVPTWWPRRSETVSAGDRDLHDRILRGFQSHQRRTLVYLGFAMGDWIGSTYMTQTLAGLEGRGHKVSVIAPGNDPAVFAREIAARGPDYEQIVLVGHPPFVQEVLERADRSSLGLDIEILLAGENITENRRDHLVSMVESSGGRANPVLLYGTADTGILGHETPSTIAVRRLARDNLELAEALFGGHTTGLPTLVEYDPRRVYAELDTDRLLITTDGPIPLVRYQINDHARILDIGQITAVLQDHGHRIPIHTTTTDAGFLLLDNHETEPTHQPKTARIRLLGHDAATELDDLVSWLRHEDDLRGRLTVEQPPTRTEMSVMSQVVSVVLAGSGLDVATSTAAVLAGALSMWLDRRRPRVSVEITRTDGHRTTIAEGQRPAAEQTRQLLEPTTN
ncbi:effector-associated constant component EACC1 [Nocardia takedensis]